MELIPNSKILFFSSMPGLADAYPIKPAKDFKFKWVESLKSDYKEFLNSSLKGQGTHLRRCPGIFEILEHGYIIPMPWDLKIRTSKNSPQSFEWEVASRNIIDSFEGNIASAHDVVGRHLPNRSDSFPLILKIDTPWSIAATPGLKFLVIPIPYPDSYEFESTHGILDPSKGTHLNLQIRWNVTNGEYMIKAGTPMVQLIPITESNCNLIVRDANAHDKKWLEKRKFLHSHSFISNKPILKKVYDMFFRHNLK